MYSEFGKLPEKAIQELIKRCQSCGQITVVYEKHPNEMTFVRLFPEEQGAVIELSFTDSGYSLVAFKKYQNIKEVKFSSDDPSNILFKKDFDHQNKFAEHIPATLQYKMLESFYDRKTITFSFQ